MSHKYQYILLYVTDLERSVAFYRDKLDFAFGEYQDKVAMLSFGSANIILHLNEEKDFVANPKKGQGVLIGFGVDDVDAYHAQVVQNGVAVLQAPKDEPWGDRDMALYDPDGYELWFSQTK